MTLKPEVMAAKNLILHQRNTLHIKIIKTEISTNVITFYNTTIYTVFLIK